MVGRTWLKIEEEGRGRREMRSGESVDVCVGKDDDVMEGELGGSVNFIGVKSNRGGKQR